MKHMTEDQLLNWIKAHDGMNYKHEIPDSDGLSTRTTYENGDVMESTAYCRNNDTHDMIWVYTINGEIVSVILDACINDEYVEQQLA